MPDTLQKTKDPFIVSFGRRANAAALEARYETAASLARALTMEESRVRNWLNGTSTPVAKDLVTLAKALGVTTDWLLRDDTTALPEGLRIRLTARLSGEAVPALAPDSPPAKKSAAAAKRSPAPGKKAASGRRTSVSPRE